MPLWWTALMHGGRSGDWVESLEVGAEEASETGNGHGVSWFAAKAHRAKPERVRRTTRERFSTIIMFIKGN